MAVDPEVNRRLRDASAELVMAEGVHQRVETAYQEIQKDPNARPEEILAMENYVRELEEIVRIRREALSDLLELAGVEEEDPDESVQEGMKDFDAVIDQIPDSAPPETEQEKLDREFRESLEEFDGMILAHNQKLEAQMDTRISQAEKEVGKQQSAVDEAEALLKSMGVDSGQQGGQDGQSQGEEAAASTDQQEASGNQTGETSTGEQAGEQSGQTSQTVQNPGQGSGTEGGSGRAVAPEDEDIVARQLREAAEKETDPELREKLWKEYEAYLDGRS